MPKISANNERKFPTTRARSAGALMSLLLLILSSSSQDVLAQLPGGRETPNPVVHPKVKAHRITRRSESRKPAINLISLLIISTPSNSKIFIDGEARGETDAKGEAEFAVTAGVHIVRVTRDGYVPQEAEVEVDPTSGSQQEVEFKLAAASVGLNIVTDPGG